MDACARSRSVTKGAEASKEGKKGWFSQIENSVLAKEETEPHMIGRKDPPAVNSEAKS